MKVVIDETMGSEARGRAPGVRKAAMFRGQEAFCLRLVSGEELEASVIQREFPTITVERVTSCGTESLIVDDFAWRGAFDFSRFDESVERAQPLDSIAIRGDDAVGVACEVMGRYQRLVARRNRASATALFASVLEAHAAFYDLANPLDKADRDHALDTWQWMLRLEPDAGLPEQLAALLHDIDRLTSSSQERIEHRARDRMDPKTTEVGERLLTALRNAGVSAEDATRTREVVRRQDEPSDDADAVLLADADALSFLAQHSSRYADHFGLAQTRRKVLHTIGRLTPRARAKLALVRLRPDVDRLVRDGHGLRQAV